MSLLADGSVTRPEGSPLVKGKAKEQKKNNAQLVRHHLTNGQLRLASKRFSAGVMGSFDGLPGPASRCPPVSIKWRVKILNRP
jgi:hypothetical protein